MGEGQGVEPQSGSVSQQPGRYQRSAGGMLGALLVTLLVILAFVAFRALNRSNLDVKPGRIDYLTQVRYAQQAGSEVVYPARLPHGWYATQVTFSPVSPGTPSELVLSMLTGDGKYAGFVASPESLSELLATYVDAHARSGAPVTVDHSVVGTWDTWTDAGGDTALVGQRGGGTKKQTLLVFGTVTEPQLEQLAGSLTTARVAR